MPDTGAIVAALDRAGLGPVRQRVPLSTLSRWRIGGAADFVVTPTSKEAVAETLRAVRDLGVPVLVIGDGSNLLFADEGFRGIIVRIGSALSDLSVTDTIVRAGAGIWVPVLARRLGAFGLSGLEHIVGIPGTLGGLVVMNGGSLRQSLGTHIVEVDTCDRNGNRHVIPRAACGFAYRTSALQRNGLVVLSATLALERGDPATIRREMIGIMAARRRKFPLRLPNCGSVFVSDPGLYEKVGPPGKAIEEAGLKGTRLGGAAIPSVHANFIVNEGGATAADVLGLIALARARVADRTGHALDAEVRYVAQDGSIVPAHEEAERRGVPAVA